MAFFNKKKSDKTLKEKIKKALSLIDVPTGGNLADYSGLSEIIITSNAVAIAISINPKLEKPFMAVLKEAKTSLEKIAKPRKVMISLTSDEAHTKDAKTTKKKCLTNE